MRYRILKLYVGMRVLPERLPPHVICPTCGASDFGRGETNLRVKVEGLTPETDVIKAFLRCEWAVSTRLRAALDKIVEMPLDYRQIRLRNGSIPPYHQVLLSATLTVGRESFEGSRCEVCNRGLKGARLVLEPLFIKEPQPPFPCLATLDLSPTVILVRADIADSLSQSGLNLHFQNVFFEGEQLPPRGPTFTDGTDWSDLAVPEEEQ